MLIPKTIVGLDFETYYDKDYTLKKLSTTTYIRSPQFLVFGVGIRTARQNKTTWYRGFNKAYKALHKYDWTKCASLAHNSHFEGLILSHHFGIKPAYYYDTIPMGRALFGMETRAGLDALSDFLHVGRKHTDYLVDVKGIRNPGREAIGKLAAGCRQDVDLMWACFRKMLELFPESELDLIHHTTKCYAQPILQINKELAKKEHTKEVKRRKGVVRKVFLAKGERLTQEKLDACIKSLRSRPRFAEYLTNLGIDPPMKVSKADPEKLTFAFAKDDLEFIALLEHPNKEVRNLVEAKTIASSSLAETRPIRFIEHADPAFPVYLNAFGAKNTHRWCMKGDTEVLTLNGWVRMDTYKETEIMQWDKTKLFLATAKMNRFKYSGSMPKITTTYIHGSFTTEHTLPTYTSKGNFLARKTGTAFGLNLTMPVSAAHNGHNTTTEEQHLRLSVAFQADGHIDRKRVKFSFRKQRKITRLIKLLDSLNIKHLIWRGSKTPETIITFLVADSPIDLSKEFIFIQLISLPYRLKRIFIEELRYWDGAINSTQIRYFTTNQHNAHVVHTIAHLCNCRAHISIEKRSKINSKWKDKYTVQITLDRTYACPPSESWSLDTHDGYVYCPTTKTGYFLVRSEGSIFITGNSGGDKANPQNQSRKGKLRHCIEAPKGYKLVIGDSGAIEARLNGYMAGQEDLVQQFRDYDATVLKGHPDARLEPYCRFASKLFGKSITKADPNERFVGKVCILALGYQMWAPRFQFTLETGTLGPKVVLDFPLYQEYVELYRREMNEIVAQWYFFNDRLKDMTYANCYIPYKGLLTFEHRKITPPNELPLQYPKLRWSTEKQGYVYREKTNLYGGKLVENSDQNLARTLVAEQIARVAEYYRLVLMVHDEGVFCVPTRYAKRVARDLLTSLRTPPAWAPDLPVAGEVGIFDHYVKM